MLTLYHAPQSRSSRVIWLLEELGADYRIVYVDIPRPNGSGAPDAANPHPEKKVPAIEHDGELVTESPAVFCYLTDLYPQAKLAPLAGEPQRGRYLSWLAYYGGVVEPVMHFEMLGIGDNASFQRTFRGKTEMDARFREALTAAPYMLGEQFSALDVLIASLGQFMRQALPQDDFVDSYLQRCASRPALQRARAKDSR